MVIDVDLGEPRGEIRAEKRGRLNGAVTARRRSYLGPLA